jgi:plasmid stabilization system protein ParE
MRSAMKELVINSRAYQDLERASSFYEEQERGCGDYFNRCLLSDILALHHLHGIHRKFFGLYMMYATKFPYTIYYRLGGNAIEVIAVLDQRRDPRWIRAELRSR